MNFPAVGIRRKLALTTLVSLWPLLLLNVALSVSLISDSLRQKQSPPGRYRLHRHVWYRGEANSCFLTTLPAIQEAAGSERVCLDRKQGKKIGV